MRRRHPDATRRARRPFSPFLPERTPRATIPLGFRPGGRRIAVGGAGKTGAEGVGMALNEPMLRAGVANARRPGRRGRVRLAVARADDLPFADGTFDAVTFSYLLRYVDDPAATVEEMARCLRPGGTLASLEVHVPPQPGWRRPWCRDTRLAP